MLLHSGASIDNNVFHVLKKLGERFWSFGHEEEMIHQEIHMCNLNQTLGRVPKHCIVLRK